MDSKTYHFFLATPEGVVFDDLIYSLIAPGMMGYLEVLSHHAPLISLLKPGKLVIKDSHRKTFNWDLNDGYLEVSSNQAIILTSATSLCR